MNNFVYAADQNYNTQLFYSIFSLLENISTEVNIFIIHKNPESFEPQILRLNSNFKNLNLSIYKFDVLNFEFPNIAGKHVSEATYYRLFIDKFIPKNVDYYIYLDADIICINNPTFYLKELVSEMANENFIIGCRTEYNKFSKNSASFDNLLMNSSKYFNAGVMLVNHQRWQKENIREKLLVRLEKLKDKIQYWDQDVLNSYFDGNYKEISRNLNFPLILNKQIDVGDVEDKGIFLHYQSNKKPWTIKGNFNHGSKFYQNYALDIDRKYHLVKTVKRYDAWDLIKNTVNFRISILEKPLNFYIESVKKLLY
jgi:lipopolysaccharide biosynthesis glycosyltransferase